jgi:hypothetical protein
MEQDAKGFHCLAYGVKNVHHLMKGAETTDYFLDEDPLSRLPHDQPKQQQSG